MSRHIPQTLLLILDGWGQAAPSDGNAVSLAHTPTLDALLDTPNKALLACSGRAVGLPEGYMGNSEVGHMNIGAGRIVYQDMTRIDMSIEDGSFLDNDTILALLTKIKAHAGSLHLMGLASNGGVHSHINHLITVANMAHSQGVHTFVHVITDGRDTDPRSGLSFVKHLLQALPKSSSIATLSGRYYAMDRDKRWERTNLAWQAIVHGKGLPMGNPIEYIEKSYTNGTTDEFMLPAVHQSFKGMQPQDGLFMANFRADRMRQLAACFAHKPIEEYTYTPCPELSGIATMTTYEDSLPFPVAFTPHRLTNGLGEVVSASGIPQLRIAETEKYAHVTFFFNGGVETPAPLEERILIPSPRDVATYDLKPEMSAFEVTESLIQAWREKKASFFVCNLANMDMVGHTGNIPAAIKACETVDACLARIIDVVKNSQGLLLVTADHGNAEEMLTQVHTPQTAHSLNPVALIINDFQAKPQSFTMANTGKLCDIAPTLLTLWNIPIPAEMTGNPLVNIHE